LTLRIEADDRKADEITKLWSGINAGVKVMRFASTERGAFDFNVEVKQGEDIRRDVFRKLASRNYPVLMMKSSELTLEEVFLKLTMSG
jgi:ABC-2 type transport system ATP-binding protein